MSAFLRPPLIATYASPVFGVVDVRQPTAVRIFFSSVKKN